MADPGSPVDYSSPGEQLYTYPDIDESIQYPWREDEAALAQANYGVPAIDPRLYQDSFSAGSGDPGLVDGYALESEDEFDDSQIAHQTGYVDEMDDDDSEYEQSGSESDRYDN